MAEKIEPVSFAEYVGQDDRVDQFVAMCKEYGLRVSYKVGSKICHVDAYSPRISGPIAISPWQHTFSINLDTDEVTMLDGLNFDDGMKSLRRMVENAATERNSAEGFIQLMRSL